MGADLLHGQQYMVTTIQSVHCLSCVRLLPMAVAVVTLTQQVSAPWRLREPGRGMVQETCVCVCAGRLDESRSQEVMLPSLRVAGQNPTWV